MKTLDQLPLYPDKSFYSSYFQDSNDSPKVTSLSSPNKLGDATSDSAQNTAASKTREIYFKKLIEIKNFLKEQQEHLADIERSVSLSNNSKNRKNNKIEKFQSMTIEQWEEYGEKLTENASKLVLKIMAFRR